MHVLARWFGSRRRKTREDIANRVAEVMAQVLFDIGIDRLLNGSMLLDRQFKPRFFAVLPAATRDDLAVVALRDLEEAHVLRAYVQDAALDAATVARYARLMSEGMMRRMLAASPALRALPERRVKPGVP